MGEYLSIETVEKLAGRDKAIKYIKNILKRETSDQVKMYIKNILNLLEVKYENKPRNIFKTCK